jgi:hypothetical protein
MTRYETDGATLLEIEDEYRAPLTESDEEEIRLRCAILLLTCEMARVWCRPPPERARA